MTLVVQVPTGLSKDAKAALKSFDELSGNIRYIMRGRMEIVTTHETLQYADYSKYVGDYKLELKEKIHKEQYPIDCRHAFEMGVKLAE